MGLKDHLEDGTGHILSLQLDLDYLHVESAERQGSLSSGSGPGNILQTRGGACSVSTISTESRGSCFSTNSSCSCSSSSSSSGSCSNLSEESAVFDSDDERLQNGSASKGYEHQPHVQPTESFNDLQQVRLDLTINQNASSQKPPEAPAPVDPVTEYRTKVEFALKLGYSEELVLMVLRKLGANALINDILGELVKLGTKTEMEQQESVSASNCPSASFLPPPLSSVNSSLDSCQLLCPSQLLDKENLRPVVVDGSNVAMSHGNKEVFSCQGIQLAVDWFLDRGHRDITVFVPAWRKEQSRPDAPITDQEILRRLEKEKILVFTPSRRVQGRRVVCYDDRFIVKLAYESDGIIVSNDNYRDLANEKPEWKKFVDERLLMYSFVNDKFMPPDDPLGRHGPSLDNFLRKKPVILRKQPCPYGKKCTYGHKCKFYHPERGTQPQRSVADELRASAKISTASSKGLVEDALMPKSQGSGAAEAEPSQKTPKKQSSTILRSSFSDLREDRIHVARRGSSSSSSSSCGSNHQGHLAPGGPPAAPSLDQWEHPVESGAGGYRVPGTSGPAQTYKYHRCKTPETNYNSLSKAYSSLSLEVPQSPDRFFQADVRASSLASDCSSEGSISSDSFSPDFLADEGLRCLHHHHQHHHPFYSHLHHHHCSGQHAHPSGRIPPGVGSPAPYGNSISQVPQKKFDIGLEETSPLKTSHGTPHPFRSPSSYSPSHLQNLPLSSFSRDFHTYPPQMPNTPSQNHNVIRSRWQDIGQQDSRYYEGLFSRRNFSAETEQPLPTINWDAQYHRSPKPYSDPFPFQSRVHSSFPGLLARNSPTPSSFNPTPFAPITPSKSPLPMMPQHQEPPTLDRYQELRERMFVNLCCIFPPDLVRSVMAKNLHVMDAQELAAAILMEKSKLES